ncbi:hypothetical protein P154DRAFT_530457 [Amniculicola lignicola CBS 123094]|uniref:Rhodopsin domain-containing protein n=1 Tax=Amniculicola lignicola CBS 123094 TaxID=1392246 RepID=A0A6A5WV97_9PLEO|nr:hypothetical protein P154DRAFT_530457 [Amniculicola lignicola CBS 123094]
MASRQPSVWATFLVTYTVALIALLLRLVARWLKGVRLSYDDYIASAAFLSTSTIYTDYFLLLWIDSWFYTTGIGLSKVAALAFYWRIFGQSNIRLSIQILFAFAALWMMARVVVISLECIPIQKFWDQSIDGVCPIKTGYFFFGSTFPHLLMEIAIVVLPLVQIRQLNLTIAQKITVAGMFMSGIIVCAASIVQLIAAFKLDTKSSNLWWTGAPQLMAAVAEVNLAHFSTSLPNLRPILDVLMGKEVPIAVSNLYSLHAHSAPGHTRTRSRKASKAYTTDGEYFDMATGPKKYTRSEEELL